MSLLLMRLRNNEKNNDCIRGRNGIFEIRIPYLLDILPFSLSLSASSFECLAV